MPENLRTENELLDHAKELERRYDWVDAAKTYESLLQVIHESDPFRRAEISERVAYSLFRHAFQCSTSEEFVSRIDDAILAYSEAKDRYAGLARTTSRILRCDAMIALQKYWGTPIVEEKKRHIGGSWNLAKQSMKGFDGKNEASEIAETYLQLQFAGYMQYSYSQDFEQRKEIVKDAIEIAELTTPSLNAREDADRMARLLLCASLLTELWGKEFVIGKEYPRYNNKAAELFNKAMELSADSAIAQLPIVGSWGAVPGPNSSEKAAGYLERRLDAYRNSRDLLVYGSALDILAGETQWMVYHFDTFDEKEAMFKKAIQYANEAMEKFATISYRTPGGISNMWIECPDVDLYGFRAFNDSSIERRRENFSRAFEESAKMLALAKTTEYPRTIGGALFQCGRFSVQMGRTETDRTKKAEFLRDGIKLLSEACETSARLSPFNVWDQGVCLNHIAVAYYELSLLAENKETRLSEAMKAIAKREEGIKLLEQSIEDGLQDPTFFWEAGSKLSILGKLLLEIYALDNQESSLHKSVEAYEKAAKYFEHGRVFAYKAESHWSAARIQDLLGAHSRSSDLFQEASECYIRAIEKTPRLKELYEEYARYMTAWSEIEHARSYHSRQEYGKAKEHYFEAARIHKSTSRWKYLAFNYEAWAYVEDAEDLSRRNQSTESIVAFSQASRLFLECGESLRSRLPKSVDEEERRLVSALIEASGIRHSYCVARTILENARNLDKNGDLVESVERYHQAADAFKVMLDRSANERDRKEVELIMTLSKAWETMAKAESEASPDLYAQASSLFEKAKDLSGGEKARLLALGNSRFCKALEAGVRFTDSGDLAMHSTACQHLESASKYYLKADLNAASEFSRASRLVFDSYVFMDKATKEEDHEKKAKDYAVAEKMLDTAALLYSKADQLGKKEQVLRLLKKVRDDRELACSLTEVFRAPDIVSTTKAFYAPAQSYEQAVGLEEFEHANIQAVLIAHPRKLTVGDTLDIEIELANGGKGSAQLTRIVEAVPPGFEVVEKPETCRLEDCNINMRGRQLGALKTEDLRLVLRCTTRGYFTLKPLINYVDGSGKDKSCKPTPIEIHVEELGISGWLKGPGKKSKKLDSKRISSIVKGAS